MSPMDRLAGALKRIREDKPLIHHITNMVVMNETANATLCVGALPVMAHAREEVEDMVGLASALVLNIGTLTPGLVDSMILAGRAANSKEIPVILDPVGVGASSLRTRSIEKILGHVNVSIIRGNAGEITVLAGEAAEVKGVESIGEYDGIEETAKRLASAAGCTVGVTGQCDHVTDGTRTFVVKNGHPLLGTVTGTGCISTSIVACFAAVMGDMTYATAAGLVMLGLAGENAAKGAEGPGSFHVGLYDALASITPVTLADGAKVEDS